MDSGPSIMAAAKVLTTFEPCACFQLCDEDTGLLKAPKQDENAYQCKTCSLTLPLTNKHASWLVSVLNLFLIPFLLMGHAVKVRDETA